MESASFWNKAAAKYAASPIADEATYQRKLAETRALLRPDMQMVEFGCGTGGTAILHAPHVANLHAVDLSQSMLDIAAKKIAEAGVKNITLECATIESADIAPASVDIILTMSLLHLLKDPAAAIARIHTMLKPGGYFVSSTACISPANLPIRAVLAGMRLFGKAPHVAMFREDWLLGAMRDAGFEIRTHWRPKPRAAIFVIAQKPA